MKRPTLKSCKWCRTKFAPRRPGFPCCSDACAVEYGEKQAGKVRAKVEKDVRKETKAKLSAIKSFPQLKAEAQIAFNRYIRFRDQSRPCICCGFPLGSDGPGGGYDAGHYRSLGSAPHLRFSEDNCHAQNKQCNRYGSGRAVDYRLGLIGRIGLQAVESLEHDNKVRHYTKDELRAIKALYLEKLKALKSETR